MGFYRERVLPPVVNVACGMKSANPLRERVCAGRSGRVVEIGFGSGLNVPFYPREVAAVEPVDVGCRLARRRVAASAVPVRRAGLDGQLLPFEDETFDAALSTWTLCTIPDAGNALAELRRVLRPGRTFALRRARSGTRRVRAAVAAPPRADAEAGLRLSSARGRAGRRSCPDGPMDGRGATLTGTCDEEVQHEDVLLPLPVGRDVRRPRVGVGRLPAGRRWRLRRRWVLSQPPGIERSQADRPSSRTATSTLPAHSSTRPPTRSCSSTPATSTASPTARCRRTTRTLPHCSLSGCSDSSAR